MLTGKILWMFLLVVLLSLQANASQGQSSPSHHQAQPGKTASLSKPESCEDNCTVRLEMLRKGVREKKLNEAEKNLKYFEGGKHPPLRKDGPLYKYLCQDNAGENPGSVKWCETKCTGDKASKGLFQKKSRKEKVDAYIKRLTQGCNQIQNGHPPLQNKNLNQLGKPPSSGMQDGLDKFLYVR